MAKVYLGQSARKLSKKPEALMRKAEAVAEGLTLPSGVEFKRFEHEGRTWALSARVVIEVEHLNHRVPDVLVRTGDMGLARRAARQRGG